MKTIEVVTTKTCTAIEPEVDANGDTFFPKVKARMSLRVPLPLRESDVVALWDVFTAELREVTGYSEEMRARVEGEKAKWDGLLYNSKKQEEK